MRNAFKESVALYALDKRVCQMIMEVEKISNDFSLEAREVNLFKPMSDEEEEKRRLDEKELERLRINAREFIREIFKFKHALNCYQAYMNDEKLERFNARFGLSKDEIKKLEG